MTTSGKPRRFAHAPLLLAAALGLVATTGGCIIDGSDNGGGGVCTPDLYVYWRVVDGNDVPMTCAQAGAGSVQAFVGNQTDEVLCPPGSSTGDPLFFALPREGYYPVNVRLMDTSGVVELSGTNPTNPPQLFVDCSGATATPEVLLCVGPNCPLVSQSALTTKKK